MSLLDALLLEEPTTPTTPVAREIFIALRNDGVAGSGTINDPYNGSTQRGESVPVTLQLEDSLLDVTLQWDNAADIVTVDSGGVPHECDVNDFVTIEGAESRRV